MANDQQYKTTTQFIGTRGVKEYRASIPMVVQPSDTVLEIGCEWGTTTKLIAEQATHTIGADVSDKVIDRAREIYPHIEFRVLDAFNVRAVVDWKLNLDVIYLDLSGLSGYRSLLDTISLLNMYATIIQPRAMVIKSGSFKDFIRRCQIYTVKGLK